MKKKLLTKIISLCFIVSLLSGCENDIRTEQVMYNVSMRNVVVKATKPNTDRYDSVYFKLICTENGNPQIYGIETSQLYYSIGRLLKTYSISNPGKPLVLDIVYNTDIERVTSAAIASVK